MVDEFSPEAPNIFLRLGKEGTVLCANKAAYAFLEYWGIKEGERVPEALRQEIRRIFKQEGPKNLEIQIGKKTYSAVFYPFPEENYINLEGFDISFKIFTEEKLCKREKQYLSLSNLNKISPTCKSLQEILEQTAMLIAKGLGVEFSRILELTPDGTFSLRAGYGWKAGPIDSNIIKEKSPAEYTLVLKRPIILEDIKTENRFECGEFLRRHGIASGVTVLIGDMNKPFGAMEVYSRETREFTEDDIHFLDSTAFLLFQIIEHLHAEEKLRIHHQELETLVEKKTLEYTEANEKLVHEVIERRKIEKKLQNNVRFLETLLDSIPSPVFQRDLNETYVNCNEIFAKQILGLSKNEVIGGSFQEFQKRVPKELAKIYNKDDRSLIEKGGSNYYETKVVCADNVQRDFLFHKAIYKDGLGDVAGVVGVMLDITKLKLIQESLERSEERYRIAAEQTGQIVYDYNRLTDKIEWAGAIKELTQYSLEEFQNFNRKTWEVHIHPDDRTEVLEKLEICRENGERFATEYRFRRKDGSYLYVEDSGIFQKNEQGHSYRDIGVMKDITGIKLASKKLRESEERYKSFMKNFRGIAFQGDLNFTPILADGSVEEITGYMGDDFISGKVNWNQIVLSEDQKKLINDNERLLKDPLLLIEHEYRIKHKDGKIKWVREIIQNVLDFTGKKRILQGAVYDITGQKEAEESLKKIEEIRKKEIHHRIKNNLQVISSLLELQAERFSEKEVLEAFRESQNRVTTMAIIHEELYRSRNSETIDFSEYLQKLTADLLRSYTVRGNIKMHLDVNETFLGIDTAIPLGIIINELVSNSLKHAFPQGEKGEIRIKLCKAEESVKNKSISNSTNNIGAKSSVNKSSQYLLVVSDNGLGFPEDLDFRNTGSLGLQLVNILVEQLEGTIELQKEIGTTFKILFRENN